MSENQFLNVSRPLFIGLRGKGEAGPITPSWLEARVTPGGSLLGEQNFRQIHNMYRRCEMSELDLDKTVSTFS